LVLVVLGLTQAILALLRLQVVVTLFLVLLPQQEAEPEVLAVLAVQIHTHPQVAVLAVDQMVLEMLVARLLHQGKVMLVAQGATEVVVVEAAQAPQARLVRVNLVVTEALVQPHLSLELLQLTQVAVVVALVPMEAHLLAVLAVVEMVIPVLEAPVSKVQVPQVKLTLAEVGAEAEPLQVLAVEIKALMAALAS